MAPKKNYTPHQMGQAIEAVRKGEKVSTAATRFGVPRITLYDKVTGRSPVECSIGHATYLSKEDESILVQWILDMSAKHIPITKNELLDSVQRIIIDKQKVTPFTDNRPGKKWYNLFLKRHPIISERTAQNLTTARDAVTEEGLKNWFDEVETYLRENNLMQVTEDPARIFNAESAFFLSPKGEKVLARRGDKHIYQSSGDEKDNLTVLITGNAAGQLAPPMVVYAYERIPSSISLVFPEDWAIGRSPSGWMCGSTFFEYIANIFSPWLSQQNIQRPVLFFLDGHRSHLTLHLSTFCVENGIEIITLHPNSTHILQPMDLSIFRPLKTYWTKAVKKWKLDHLGQNLKKENFAPVLKTALQSITEVSIKSGFRAGGLYPFGPDYVDVTKIKSRAKSQVDSTAQKHFVAHLEKEIASKFGPEKLQFFKELFYKSRCELDSRLHEEDVSLYVIWANNKQTVDALIADTPTSCDRSDQTASTSCSKTCPRSDFDVAQKTPLTQTIRPDVSSKTLDISTTRNTETTTEDHQSSKQSNDALIADVPSSSNQDTEQTIQAASTSRSETNSQKELTITQRTPLKQTITPEPSSKTLDTSTNHNTETTAEDHQSSKQSNDAFIADVSSSKNQNTEQTIQTASTSSASTNYQREIVAQKTPLKQTIRPEVSSKTLDTSTIRNTKTATTTLMKKGNSFIPSPFKRNLFWPGDDDTKKGKKRKLREKIPCAITSQSWREYHEKKDLEKIEKEKEKERKAKEREQKKQLKQEIKNQSKKRNKNRSSKRKSDDETSSDNTDTEIHYAESDNSYNIELDEEMIEEEQQKKIEIKSNLKEKENPTSSESEDVPLSRVSKKAKRYSKGDYVIIKYEGEYFPGVIVNVQRNTFEISTMTFSVGNTFRWPEKPDQIWYKAIDIVETIGKPVLTNKRGFYTIKEMSKYLPFTM